jgi:hypothetical protein
VPNSFETTLDILDSFVLLVLLLLGFLKSNMKDPLIVFNFSVDGLVIFAVGADGVITVLLLRTFLL